MYTEFFVNALENIIEFTSSKEGNVKFNLSSRLVKLVGKKVCIQT